MNKSIGSLSSSKSNVKPKKHVTLERVETIPSQLRDYGYIKTNQLSTPFPRKSKPVDLEAVTAKLEAASKIQLRSTKSSQSVHDRNRMRRKLFDQGEYLICKGLKTTDKFHPGLLEHRRQGDRLVAEQNRDKRYFEEVTKFCIANNIKIAKGNL